MTREEIEATAWAKRFKKDCGQSYSQAIDIALRTRLVIIEKRDDNSFLGDYQFAITTADADEYEDDFWLDAFDTKKEALSLCREMGWMVKK